MQPTGEFDGSGQSAGRDGLARSCSSTCRIQVVEDEGYTAGPFFNLRQACPNLFVRFGEKSFINLVLPRFPELLSLVIQHMLLWRERLQPAVDSFQ
jgi:hypothetical protein